MPKAEGGHRPRRRATAPPPQPADLQSYRRMVELSIANAGHTHGRLVPELRGLAAQRLRSRSHIDVDREPERARAEVFPATWELIRPDRPAPARTDAAGVSIAQLEAVIAELESLG